MKTLTVLTGLFILIGLSYLYLTAPGLAIALTVAAIVLFAVFSGVLAAIFAYHRLGQARLINAQAFATTISAAQVPDTIAALALPTGSKVTVNVLPVRPGLHHVAVMPAQVEPVIELQGLPTAPVWSDVLADGFEPTPKKLLLGFDHAGPVYGDLTALLSTAVAGRPGQGKSSLLRLVAAQMQAIGGLTALLDPHGSISEDVPIDAVFNACTGSELDDAGYWLINELERRLASYRKGKRDFTPLMALNDEFPVISLASKEAVAAVGRVVLEGRKVKMFSLISGQGLPASQFGGSLIRDALSSRYIFQTTNRQGQLAGLDKDSAKMLDRLDVGRCILDGPIKPRIVAIPFVRSSDLLGLTDHAQGDRREPFEVGNAQSTATGPETRRTAYTQSESNSPGDVVTASYRELPPAPGEVERAYRAWKAGNNSVRKLALALGCSDWQARKLIDQLRAEGRV